MLKKTLKKHQIYFNFNNLNFKKLILMYKHLINLSFLLNQ